MVVENVVAAGLSVLALALTAIGAASWRRAREPALLVLTAAFALFFAKGLALTLFLLLGYRDLVGFFLITSGFDVAILASFYVFTLRR